MNWTNNLKPSKQTVYFSALFGTVLCIFIFLIFISSNKEATTQDSNIPNSSDSKLSQILGLSNQRTNQTQAQQQMIEQTAFGPTKPSINPTPSPTPSPTPTPAPTSTPTPTPTPTQNNNHSEPTPSPSPSPTPTPTPCPTNSNNATSSGSTTCF